MLTCDRCAHTQEDSTYCQRCGGDLHAGSSSKEPSPLSLSSADESWGPSGTDALPRYTAPAEGWADVQWDVAAPPPPPPIRAQKRANHRGDEWTRCGECGCRGTPETRCRNL